MIWITMRIIPEVVMLNKKSATNLIWPMRVKQFADSQFSRESVVGSLEKCLIQRERLR